jgi:hypothetical protein
MKVRALCAAGLVVVAAAPATASAGSSIRNRLHRADVALNKAQDAVDDGNEARVLSSLKGANRQTALALKATLRLVARDRGDADIALADTADQLDANAQAVTDMLGDASPAMVEAINTTLVAVDTGRGQILTTVQGLGDLKPDWADALAELADDAVTELTVAADNYEGLSSDADDALSTFVTHETDAAGAIVFEVVAIAAEGDAVLDGELLETLEADAADAADALDSVAGLAGANATAVDEVVVKLQALGEVLSTLVDDVYAGEDDYWDDEEYYDEDYVDGYADGYADAFTDWGWSPRGDGYRGWDDDGFRPGRH